MINQSLRRLNFLLITLLFLTIIAFSILRLDVNSTYRSIPFVQGYLHYILQLIHGNLGFDEFGQPIIKQLAKLIPATIELCTSAFVLSLIIGIPLGTIAGIYRGKPVDKVISSLTTIIQSVPIFWGAIALIILFSIQLGWLPTSDRIDILYHVPSVTGFIFIDIFILDSPEKNQMYLSALRHLILPTLTLSILPTTSIVQTLRLSVSKIMQTNYVKASVARGSSRWSIIRHHVIGNAMPEVLPQLSMQLAQIVTFAMIVENMYLWPGVGQWLINMIQLRDYTAIQGGIIMITLFVLTINLVGELLMLLIISRKNELF